MAFAHRLHTWISLLLLLYGVNAICLPDVPLSSNVPSAAIRVLAFRYKLGEKKEEEDKKSTVQVARELLAAHGGVQAIFFVDGINNINNFHNIHLTGVQLLRNIVRDGHLVIDTSTDNDNDYDYDYTKCNNNIRFEAALGFHLPMSIQTNNNNNNNNAQGNSTSRACSDSGLKLHLDRISLLEDEAALNHLRNNDSSNNNNTHGDMHNPMSLLSEAQLLCTRQAMGCDFVGKGELLYRFCNGIYGNNNGNNNGNGNVKALDNININSNKSDGFVDRNRARIELAYAHMNVAHKSKWRNLDKSVKQVLDLLYVLTDGEVADARKTGVWKYLKLYRHNNRYRNINRNINRNRVVSAPSSTAESSAYTCTAAGRRALNYPVIIAALVLCTLGCYGLSPYASYASYSSYGNNTSNCAVPPKITIRKLVRTLSNVRSTAEDFSKVV